MGRTKSVQAALAVALLLGSPAGAGEAELEARLEALQRQNEAMFELIQELQAEMGAIRAERATNANAPAEAMAAGDGAGTDATETAETGVPTDLDGVSAAPAGIAAESPRDDVLFSRRVGNANLQLLDVSLDVLAAAGVSSAVDEELAFLQGGEHDPRQRGFTLQQVELGFQGAIDPYMRGEAYVVYFIDQEGESRFELEEAFLTTMELPFSLDEHGVQIEAGHFFTEFGRLNPTHPHAWDWQDQPFVMTRFFGGDGARGTGVRVGWLTPLPWFSEVHLGMQNAGGETMVSYRANDEVFEERPIGGRPFADAGVRSTRDFTYLARWVNGIDLGETASAQLGASALFGANATGPGGWTNVFGGDLVVKWSPLDAERGWPFVKFETEFLYREYQADSFFGCVEVFPTCALGILPGNTLYDHGLYTQLLWGFVRNWAVGLRYEYGNGNNANVAYDDGLGRFVRDPIQNDPFRSPRHRVAPLLVFQPTEFSRLRLQYNYDRVTFLEDPNVHSLWFGVEFLFGAHPAHAY